MTEFKAFNELCLLPENIDSELFNILQEEYPDDIPLILQTKQDLEIFFENMYDIKDVDTYNICAFFSGFLNINNYYPYHYLNGITSSERLSNYYKIPDYIFTLNIEEIIEANDLHFIIIKNLVDEPYKLWKFSCLYGKLDIVKWLYENRIEYTTDAMDYAAKNGHLNVVIWLHENRNEGCTIWAISYAAKNGHLDVVKWLHENRRGVTIYAMNWATRNCHFDVVEYLQSIE